MRAMKTIWFAGVLLGCLTAGCSSAKDRSVKAEDHRPGHAVVDDDDDEDDGEEESEEAVALDQVPEAVKQAARDAVPGFVAKSAEKETEHGTVQYCLEGTAGGERVEVEVRASDAKVTEVERGDDEDEDD